MIIKKFTLMQKINYLILFVFRNFLGFFISLFIWRDKNIILFGNLTESLFEGQKRNDNFLHNTKYLFLYLTQNISNLKIIYLCDDKEMILKFKNIGFQNVYQRKNLKGIYYSLKSKYWFTDYNTETVTSSWFSYNAKVINLWHGIPLKKIHNDDPKMHHDMSKITSKIRQFLMRTSDYYIVNGEYEQECYHTAFVKEKENIKILGSTRLDVLLHDIPNSELFMEDDFDNIKKIKNNGKNIIIYMPTYRDSGKNIFDWLKSDNLKQFLKNNNTILICKLHPGDKNSLNFDLGEEFYKMDSKSDIYPILKYSDCLITDYSSVYFDYLLLDKPIIYYPIDLEEYEATRGFYKPYEELTAGIKTYNEEELISAMKDVINGTDDYKEQRKILRDKMFVYQDGRNCERLKNLIQDLT